MICTCSPPISIQIFEDVQLCIDFPSGIPSVNLNIVKSASVVKSLRTLALEALLTNKNQIPAYFEDEILDYCKRLHKQKMYDTFFVIQKLQQPHGDHPLLRCCNVVNSMSSIDYFNDEVLEIMWRRPETFEGCFLQT